jgi:hypothetical protein
MRWIKYYIDADPAAGGPAVPAVAPAAPIVLNTPGTPATTPAVPGGGNPPGAPPAPKGYTVTTPQERSDWNGFLDYASKQGGNVSDPKQQATLLGQYKKANPDFSITADRIPAIQYEAYQFRKGDSFGNLGSKELGYLRQGMSPNFLNADTSNIGKLYYPQEGSYGTDVENYYNSKFNPSAAKPLPAATTLSTTTPGAPSANPSVTPPGAIPRPDYTDPASRLDYAKQIVQKYGPLMSGRGDTFLRMNEVPMGGTDTAKNLSIKAFGKLGIDPALGYASAMEEGMSGEFKGQDGNYEKEDSGDKKFPVTGSAAYGLDNFVSRFPDLVKKGYLPASFKDEFVPFHPKDGSTEDSANYKTADDALQAKAAFLKSNYDEVDQTAKSKGVTLSPKARDFFALVNYNAGSGTGSKMIDDYNKNGQLQGDKFLQARPTTGQGLSDKSYKQVYENVIRRIKMADALKQEQLFDQPKK